MLSVGGFPTFASGALLMPTKQQFRHNVASVSRIDLQEIVSEFLQGDALRVDSEDQWSTSLTTDVDNFVPPLGQDFEEWFEALFGSEEIRSSINDYLR